MSRALILGAIVSMMSAAPAAMADPRVEDFHAALSGFDEVGVLGDITGAILTDGRGTLDLRLNRVNQTLTYKLTFSGLSAPVAQAHIHFGKTHVAGGIMVFLCSNLPNPPAGTPACPAAGGTVSGTLTAANLLALPGQNVPANNFDALEDVLETSTSYVNVHTTAFPAGEIRGEIRREFGSHDD